MLSFFLLYIFSQIVIALQLSINFVMVLLLFPSAALLGAIGLLVWIEWDRRQTSYGVSKDSIWVKRSIGTLQSYKIASLPQLKCNQDTIFYSTIINNIYTKHALLQNIPRASMVYELIQETQQK
ncbi:MAG: hypothetical protein ACRBFS_00355 [Aureispira sp.]